ncbi:Hypothetical protein I595_3259 [Croceitalea dokdonensis DOKDO 023]|uniref:Uncharacterized protein n=1 Tax=Croceitalea dokdonensis DOKDO 023 TaxID=1300341 RepID=A0A0P7AF36_9FLAO|nr:Hypothetical protein I595_3259 [Croceitalea dokdonensis DOKDO 023]
MLKAGNGCLIIPALLESDKKRQVLWPTKYLRYVNTIA